MVNDNDRNDYNGGCANVKLLAAGIEGVEATEGGDQGSAGLRHRMGRAFDERNMGG